MFFDDKGLTLQIIRYKTKDGKEPFGKWLDGLSDLRAHAKILVRLNRIKAGNLGDHRPVGEGVSELRIMEGPGYRVYFGEWGDEIVVLLCGGDKSSQSDDIATAKERWTDWKSRQVKR